MSETTKIEWADMTWNPWWGPGASRVRGVESYLALPAKWNKAAEKSGIRPKVFCLSFGDWLDEAVPMEWTLHLLETIRTTPHLDWLLLTKRPENWIDRIERALCFAEGLDHSSPNWMDAEGPDTDLGYWINEWTGSTFPENVWIGTSVEDQKRADERIPELLQIPAKVRFLSCEPLLGPIEFSNHSGRGDVHPQIGKKPLAGIDWVIVGGESGSKDKARVCALEWVDGIRRQCEAVDVPCFVKQLGSRPYVENANLWDWPVDDELGLYCDPPESVKAFAAVGVMLKHPKGGDWEEWPEPLRVRQFPKG